jgi:CBS domain containing-hemolysin-like protein
MRWSIWVFRWFVAVLNGSGVFLLRRLAMTGDGRRHVHSPEELELLIAESRDGGLLEPDEQRRLHQALRFGLRAVRQLMVPRTAIVGIDVDWPGERVLETALSTPFSRLPAYEGSIDRVIGVLHTRDLVLGHVQHRPPGGLREVVRPAHVVPETMTADQVLRFLREQRTHLALVIDEFGGIAGLVTLEDVLSELLGDFGDEPADRPERLPDGRLRMSGQLALDEAQQWLGTTWESEADTIAGHLMQALGRLPARGEHLTIDGIRFEVERLHGRVPGSLLITPRPGQTEAPGG